MSKTNYTITPILKIDILNIYIILFEVYKERWIQRKFNRPKHSFETRYYTTWCKKENYKSVEKITLKHSDNNYDWKDKIYYHTNGEPKLMIKTTTYNVAMRQIKKMRRAINTGKIKFISNEK